MLIGKTFIDRENELRILENSYAERPGFLIVYGRRRVGKTRLLQEFLRTHKGIYYLARLTSHKENLEGLCRAIESMKPRFCSGKAYNSIDSLLLDAVKEGIDLIVIDEFTYWIRVAPRILSELQAFVDNILPNTRLLLIVSGSLVGIIEKDVLGGGSPLYARRTMHIKLEPFKPWHLKMFLPNLNPVERIMVYASVGGIPYYLQLFAKYNDLEHAYRELFLSKHGLLYGEPDFLLHEEFRNPSTYSRILKAVSNGYNRLGKISEHTGVPKTHLPAYLEKLERIGFVKHVVPLWSRKGYYVVSDYFLSFYYYVIDRVKELVELELEDEAWILAKKLINEYMGHAYERIVYDLIPLLYRRKLVPKPVIVGKYVYKGIDIDLVVIDHYNREACLIEVKWSNIDDQYAREILHDLEKKAKIKALKGYKIKHLIIARRDETSKYNNIVVDPYKLGI